MAIIEVNIGKIPLLMRVTTELFTDKTIILSLVLDEVARSYCNLLLLGSGL